MKILCSRTTLCRSGVYFIRNGTTGKIYIGSTVLLQKRLGEHRKALRAGRHHSVLLQRAFDKYGEADFLFGVLVICDPADCLLYEQIFLDHFRSATPQNGYNICPTAGNSLGRPVTPELRANMSRAKKGVPQPPESNKKRSAALKGRTRPPRTKEHAEAIAKGLLGHKHTDQAKRNMGNSHKGKKHSSEAKAKMSQSQQGHEVTAETRAKIGQANRGRKLAPFSPERIARMTEANRKSAEKRRLAKVTF